MTEQEKETTWKYVKSHKFYAVFRNDGTFTVLLDSDRAWKETLGVCARVIYMDNLKRVGI